MCVCVGGFMLVAVGLGRGGDAGDGVYLLCAFEGGGGMGRGLVTL